MPNYPGALDAAIISGTHFQDIPILQKFDKENTREYALVTCTLTVIRITGIA